MTGKRNKSEERHFQHCIGGPHQLQEMFQPEHTHASASALPRLDRIYSNFHSADLLDRHVRAAALEWKPTLSAHRAVYFCRQAPHRLQKKDWKVSAYAVQHEDFSRRTMLEYYAKKADEPQASRTRQLILLEDSVKEVGSRLDREARGHTQAVELEDRLGVVMKYLRAVENGAPGEISICLEKYPHLKELVGNPYQQDGNLTVNMQRVRDRSSG